MGLHIFKSGIKENSGVTPGLAGAEFTIKLNADVEKAYKQGYTYEEVWNGIDEDGNLVTVEEKRVAEAQKIAPTYEIITTDENGDAYTQNKLPFGKYIVKETKTPADYETSVDFTFSITEDESEVVEIAKKTKHIVVNNEQLETYIKLIKKDLKTNKPVTLNSTTFEIKATEDIYDRATKEILYKKGETISQKVGNTTYTSFTTNADNIVIPDYSYNSENDNKAEVTTPLKLPVGSYEITEIKIPEGFLQLDKPVTFEIKNIKDYDTDKDGDFIKEIVIKNYLDSNAELVESYVVLDDADMSIAFVPQMVRTYDKLTEENTKEIMDALSYRYAIVAKDDRISVSDNGREYGRAIINLVNVKNNILACIFMECENIEKKKVELLRTAAISNSLKMNKNITAYLFMADKLAAFAKNVSLGGIPLYSPDTTANYVYFNIRAYNFYASNKDLIMKLLSEITGKR